VYERHAELKGYLLDIVLRRYVFSSLRVSASVAITGRFANLMNFGIKTGPSENNQFTTFKTAAFRHL